MAKKFLSTIVLTAVAAAAQAEPPYTNETLFVAGEFGSVNVFSDSLGSTFAQVSVDGLLCSGQPAEPVDVNGSGKFGTAEVNTMDLEDALGEPCPEEFEITAECGYDGTFFEQSVGTIRTQNLDGTSVFKGVSTFANATCSVSVDGVVFDMLPALMTTSKQKPRPE
jgi:hypothetical protein